MTLTPGTHLGPYEILAPLGAGGMGEVWKAKDSRLDRLVAVKVLPSEMAANTDALARFEREAKAVAALNHPNITGIFDIGHVDDTAYAVMELLEGESLRTRLQNGALTPRLATELAVQMAHGLAAAHDKGVIHRDLKPDNLWITTEGRLKILDFGLAKQVSPTKSISQSYLATEAVSPGHVLHTEEGMILGTMGYMSPEQVRGETVDARSDIFSFGVVLFEMLTGQKAFTRDTAADTMAAILKEDPPELEASGNLIPMGLRKVLNHCLEKLPSRRFQGAQDLAFALENAAAPASNSNAPFTAPFAPPNRRTTWKWASLAALLVLGAGLLGWAFGGGRNASAHPMRLAFLPPEGIAFDPWNFHYAAISPDGLKVVFSGRGADGQRQLWVRRLDGVDGQALPDTVDAIEPFWSPDSLSVGFGAQGKLKRVDLGGARAQTLCDAARLNYGSSWGRGGVILFIPDYSAGIHRIPAGGGAPELVIPTDWEQMGGGGPAAPSFFPDGRHFLFSAQEKVFAGSLDSKDVKPLPNITGPVAFVPPGWLLNVRNGSLVAQAFDAGGLRLKGDPFPLTALAPSEDRTRNRISASGNGVLLMPNSKPVASQLVWFNRDGTRLGTLGEVEHTIVSMEPQLSPDGKQVVVQRIDPTTRNQDIWTLDVARGTYNRLTTDPLLDQSPLWSPDGSRVIFMSRRVNTPGIYEVAATGGPEKLLLQGVIFPTQVSSDGRFLLYHQRGVKTRVDQWILPLSGDRKPYAILDSEFEELSGQISPDGHWIAYSSDVTGTFEIYVRPFSAEGRVGAPTRVSTGSGRAPRWRRDGRELFYVAAPANPLDAQLMAVAVKTSGGALEIGAAKALFQPRKSAYWTRFGYDVSADGQRFLVETVVGEPVAPSVNLMLNWPAAMKR